MMVLPHDDTSSPPRTTTPAAEIERTIRLLHPGADARWEIRAPNVPRMGAVSGCYDDVALCARDVIRMLDRRAPAVNILLNVPHRDILARAYNKLKAGARTTTADTEIVQRQWLPIDCDPQRLTGISSTDAEHEASLAKARAVAVFLIGCGLPVGILADSGNGGHLDLRIDLPPDDESRDLIKRFLDCLAAAFDDPADCTPRITIDRTTYNAARIIKLYGTMAGKGDDVPQLGRPHRRSRLLEVPEIVEVVTREQILAVCELLAPAVNVPPTNGSRNGHTSDRPHGAGWIEDVGDYLARHGIAAREKPATARFQCWELDACVWDPAHSNGSAFVQQFPSGAIAAGCHHNSCSGKHLAEFRDAVERGWRTTHDRAQQNGHAPTGAPRDGQTTDNREANEEQSAPGWRPNAQSARELMAKELPPVRWHVQELFAEGLTLLAAKPKKGKSTLMLSIGFSIAHGAVALGHFKTEQSEVMYLALEDTERRMQRRLKRMLQDRQPPAGLWLFYEWLPLDRGGLTPLEAWLDEHPHVRFVVIDTLEHIRPIRKIANGLYGDDYASVRALQQLAGRRQIAIVVITHLRKAPADDPFDEINASSGLLSGVDNAIVMRPAQGVMEVYRRGREYEDDTPLALKGDKETLLWSWQGNAEDVQRGRERKAILTALENSEDPLSPKELAAATGMRENNVSFLLSKMVEAGEVVRPERGQYTLPAKNAKNAKNANAKPGGKPPRADLSDLSDPLPTAKDAKNGGTPRQDTVHQGNLSDLSDLSDPPQQLFPTNCRNPQHRSQWRHLAGDWVCIESHPEHDGGGAA